MQCTPTERRWLVTACWCGRTLMESDCDSLPHATALAAVLAAFWPGLTVSCRARVAGTATRAA